jgi:hypothetical protein
MSITRWIVVVLATGLLSACFVSHGDLIVAGDADYPIAAGTHFTVWKLDGMGRHTGDKPVHIVVTRSGPNYVYDEKGEKPVTGLMDDVGGGNYIVLFHDQDHPGQSIYGAVHKAGKNWLSHAITCPDFARLAEAHGKSLADFRTADDGGNCAFSNYDDLKSAVLFELAYGKPDKEYVAK